MCAGTCIYFLVSRVTLRCSSVNKCPCLTTKVYSDFQHCLFGLWSVVTSFCFQILHFVWWSFYLFIEVSVFWPKIVGMGYHQFEKYLWNHCYLWENIYDIKMKKYSGYVAVKFWAMMCDGCILCGYLYFYLMRCRFFIYFLNF